MQATWWPTVSLWVTSWGLLGNFHGNFWKRKYHLIALFALSPPMFRESKSYFMKKEKDQIVWSGFSELIAFFFWPIFHFRNGCKEDICRWVKGCFTRILDDTNNEAHADYLHSNIIVDTKEAASDRNQEEGTTSYSRSPTGWDGCTILRTRAVPKSTWMPKVLTAARVKVLIVTAAPAILIVDPRGIETE